MFGHNSSLVRDLRYLSWLLTAIGAVVLVALLADAWPDIHGDEKAGMITLSLVCLGLGGLAEALAHYILSRR
ncbi:hypothetical protein [Nocardia sp. NPDC056100]|uniref:hypothetical protein n=1 Tax=Nocardia sp. NPDC056100 TaxID=3345712 RepID=UPI0035D5A3F1